MATGRKTQQQYYASSRIFPEHIPKLKYDRTRDINVDDATIAEKWMEIEHTLRGFTDDETPTLETTTPQQQPPRWSWSHARYTICQEAADFIGDVIAAVTFVVIGVTLYRIMSLRASITPKQGLRAACLQQSKEVFFYDIQYLIKYLLVVLFLRNAYQCTVRLLKNGFVRLDRSRIILDCYFDNLICDFISLLSMIIAFNSIRFVLASCVFGFFSPGVIMDFLVTGKSYIRAVIMLLVSCSWLYGYPYLVIGSDTAESYERRLSLFYIGLVVLFFVIPLIMMARLYGRRRNALFVTRALPTYSLHLSMTSVLCVSGLVLQWMSLSAIIHSASAVETFEALGGGEGFYVALGLALLVYLLGSLPIVMYDILGTSTDTITTDDIDDSPLLHWKYWHLSLYVLRTCCGPFIVFHLLYHLSLGKDTPGVYGAMLALVLFLPTALIGPAKHYNASSLVLSFQVSPMYSFLTNALTFISIGLQNSYGQQPLILTCMVCAVMVHVNIAKTFVPCTSVHFSVFISSQYVLAVTPPGGVYRYVVLALMLGYLYLRTTLFGTDGGDGSNSLLTSLQDLQKITLSLEERLTTNDAMLSSWSDTRDEWARRVRRSETVSEYASNLLWFESYIRWSARNTVVVRARDAWVARMMDLRYPAQPSEDMWRYIDMFTPRGLWSTPSVQAIMWQKTKLWDARTPVIAMKEESEKVLLCEESLQTLVNGTK